MILGVVLAGGGSERMGAADKVTLPIAGKRLIDRVIERLRPQVDELVISGPEDFATGFPFVVDQKAGPLGPLAGLYAAYQYSQHMNDANAGPFDAIVTVPADGPFFPGNLVAKLTIVSGASAYVQCGVQKHATFARYAVQDLHRHVSALEGGKGAAIRRFLDLINAEPVAFEEAEAFFNINTPEDAAAAMRFIDSA